jgi:adenosylhomocysteinase
LERLNEVDFDWCIEQTLFFEDRKPLNMILDDGGDLTNMVIDRYPELVAGIKGLSEETTTGVHRLYESKSGNITNAINVNDSVTKSTTNTVVKNLQLMQYVVQLIMLAGKEWLCGYGDVGKGTAAALLEVLDLLLQLKSIHLCATSCNGRF